MKRVENKVILVTGGAMGMGRSHSGCWQRKAPGCSWPT